jgi:type I restriction enzyme S subunit
VPPRKAASLRLQNGDLLFNEGGDRDKLGRGWVWHGEIDDCIHQNHVFRARLTDSRLVPEMVSWWGNTFGRFWFESHGKQTTNLASINLKTLKSFPVPVPPSGEGPVRVTEAQRRLSIIEACAHDVKRSIERIAVLRRSLLVAAFSGRLVPQDPDDEPASELLARIAKTRAEAEAAEKEAKAAARRAKKAAKETMA